MGVTMQDWEDMTARVVRVVLSDDSVAWNVEMRVGNYPGMALLTIGARDAAHARHIARALNDGSAWAEVDCDA